MKEAIGLRAYLRVKVVSLEGVEYRKEMDLKDSHSEL
jgi:hypothetical protein